MFITVRDEHDQEMLIAIDTIKVVTTNNKREDASVIELRDGTFFESNSSVGMIRMNIEHRISDERLSGRSYSWKQVYP